MDGLDHSDFVFVITEVILLLRTHTVILCAGIPQPNGIMDALVNTADDPSTLIKLCSSNPPEFCSAGWATRWALPHISSLNI